MLTRIPKYGNGKKYMYGDEYVYEYVYVYGYGFGNGYGNGNGYGYSEEDTSGLIHIDAFDSLICLT